MSPPDPKALLSELVRIKSPSGEEAAIVEEVGDLCRTAGVDFEIVGGGLLARFERGAGPRLLLTSHLDTVPAGQSWTGDPYDAEWKDGRLMALGANDAKASVVGMLCATFAAVRDPSFQGELVLALNACEETTNAGMAAVLEALEAPPDLAIVGEPTNLEVVRSQAGLAILLAHWSGASCHAAHVTKVEHENALFKAAQDLASFGAFVSLASEHALFEESTLVPTQIKSGRRHNIVPDLAEVVVDARLAPDHDAETCVEYLERHLPQATISVRSSRLRPVDTAASHPLVTTALEVLGKEQAVASSTMSDMALLAGVPAIKCGPGRTERSHAADEYVTESELLAGCAFYETMTSRIAATLAGQPT